MSRIAFDFDMTLSRAPSTFGDLIMASQTHRMHHYIITGRPESHRQKTIDELMGFGIDPQCFEEIVLFPEYYAMSEFSSEKLKRISDWKAEQCKRLNIDILFEDNVMVIDSIKRINPSTLVGIII